MTLEKLVEDAIITDFHRDSTLNGQLIRNHDYPLTKAGDDLPEQQEARSVVTVTAHDRGDYAGVIGAGIRNVGIEVEVRVNAQADGFAGTLLDQVSEKVRDRLQTSAFVSLGASVGREGQFSNSNVQVFGIVESDVTPRTDSGFERIRVVTATFVAAQLV